MKEQMFSVMVAILVVLEVVIVLVKMDVQDALVAVEVAVQYYARLNVFTMLWADLLVNITN